MKKNKNMNPDQLREFARRRSPERTKMTRREFIKLAFAAVAALIAYNLKLLRHEFRGLSKSQRNEAAMFQINFAIAKLSSNQEQCIKLYNELAERYSDTEDPEYKTFLQDELGVYLEFMQEMERFEEENLGSLVSEVVGSFNQGKINKETFQIIFNLISQRFPNSRHLPEMQRLLQQ